MEANYVHKDSTTLVQDETGAYIEIPRNRITFKSKDAEIIFDLTLENDELRLKNKKLKEKVKKLSQWDINKDTRNSRQRVANAKLINENQELKKQLKDKTEDYKRMKDNFDSKVDVLTKIEIQQKEFIKWLEDEIHTIETTFSQINGNYGLMNEKLEALKEVLQKYKSIIGVEDEKK